PRGGPPAGGGGGALPGPRAAPPHRPRSPAAEGRAEDGRRGGALASWPGDAAGSLTRTPAGRDAEGPMSQLPIDLDAEAIQYDGHWYTREDLARRIRQMLDAGDFAVGKPSNALEQLTTVLASLRTLAFRLPPEMADQLNQAAARHGRT